MSDLHPSVKEFKAFVKKHPGLVKEVNQKGNSWQDFYEMWVLLGEEDEKWKEYQPGNLKGAQNGEKSASEDSQGKQQQLASQFMQMIEKVDLNKVQGHMHQLNGAINNIQTLIGQFQEFKKHSPAKQSKMHQTPWSKD
ncbi:spore coat protein YlbD [Sediminibacillus halophilus]|uniref:Putative coat protein n=1 Tax=Sediminibacillus halophilus TaxID=482461 RepID=A0A1G9MVM3_9BACI|nr:spore coat protein YlbD [Sediminibacillus halophilus]SDL77685.1 Putative coat protein [Sediminibacillus halophilus]